MSALDHKQYQIFSNPLYRQPVFFRIRKYERCAQFYNKQTNTEDDSKRL